MTFTTRLTHTYPTGPRRTLAVVIAALVFIVVISLALGDGRAVVIGVIALSLILLLMARVARLATVLTPTGIRQRRRFGNESVAWSDVTDVEVVGRVRRVRIVTEAGSIRLFIPAHRDPEFAEKVEQIRAAWLAATGAGADASPPSGTSSPVSGLESCD